ncbi:MAG: DUF2807 domain-containing protein [Chitinophagaceae bacterium]|nr:DUF2807 domain-containing protein [Chitinophagaceae bacterium]
MKKLLLTGIGFLTLSAWAQESNLIQDANAQKRELNGSFNAIYVSDGIQLNLSQGNEESLAVSASDEKQLARFKTEVKSGTLYITYDNKGVSWVSGEKRKLKAYVSFKTMEKLTASAGAEVNVKGAMELGDLSMKFTSGSVFNGKANARQLHIEQNSGSEINISGKAEKMNVEASSGAILKGFEFSVDYCDARASSGALVRITIQKELNARASSGGGIKYKGEALIRDISINSGGMVKRA